MGNKKQSKKMPLKKQTIRKQGEISDRDADQAAGGASIAPTTGCRKAGE